MKTVARTGSRSQWSTTLTMRDTVLSTVSPEVSFTVSPLFGVASVVAADSSRQSTRTVVTLAACASAQFQFVPSGKRTTTHARPSDLGRLVPRHGTLCDRAARALS